MDSMEKTTVLYLDSMPWGVLLATHMQFAWIIVEWDAIRQGRGIDEPIDVALIESVNSRVAFESVKVSQHRIYLLSNGDEFNVCPL